MKKKNFQVSIIILFVTYYWSLRGDPKKDCPSCGAFAGSIKYISKKEDFHSYQYQTKSGKPDRRYSYNPELFSLSTIISCSEICEAYTTVSKILIFMSLAKT